jgi:hypothetical protein
MQSLKMTTSPRPARTFRQVAGTAPIRRPLVSGRCPPRHVSAKSWNIGFAAQFEKQRIVHMIDMKAGWRISSAIRSKAHKNGPFYGVDNL